MESTVWKPVIELNLLHANSRDFAVKQEEFAAYIKKLGTLVPLTVTSGWVEVTPQMAEQWLTRNPRNRRANIKTVEAYAQQMVLDQWERTGQSVIFTDRGELLDGQHRLWAVYLGGKAVWMHILTEVPHKDHLFAFVDNIWPRTAADALHIIGVNGLSKRLSSIVEKIAWYWDRNGLWINGNAKLPKPSNYDVMQYVQANPLLHRAVELVEANYKAAVIKLGGDYVVAGFLAWKIIEAFDEDVLDSFMLRLVATDLPDNDPLTHLQKRLDNHVKAKMMGRNSQYRKNFMTQNVLLATCIKAFNAMVRGRPVRNTVLNIVMNEDFPQLIDPASLVALDEVGAEAA